MQTAHPVETATKPSHIKDFLLLFSIPIGIALLAAAFVYIPRLFAHPTYDFVYSYCPSYDCNDAYSLSAGGRLNKVTTSTANKLYNSPTLLYYYDASADATHTITYDDAANLSLLNSSRSPEGYRLARNNGSSGGFLFFGSDYTDSWQLENGLKRRTVHLNTTQAYSSNDITFLGWVNK